MDAHFQDQALDALARLWRQHRDGDVLDSRDVYDQLIADGVQIPIGALDAIFTDLQDRLLIEAVAYADPAGVRAHGARLILRVSPGLLRSRPRLPPG
jgi:hypothetical protein